MLAARSQDQAIASRVINSMLWPRAQPSQLRREFSSIGACHGHLLMLGFKLIEKREHYGGPRLESGPPVGPILLWLQARVLVRIKPRGEPATARFRQGLAHMSVCALSGDTDERGRLRTDYSAEIGKFSAAGTLVAKSPGPAMAASPDWLAKSAGETWSDDTHFIFPDLVCDDSAVDRLVPAP